MGEIIEEKEAEDSDNEGNPVDKKNPFIGSQNATGE